MQNSSLKARESGITTDHIFSSSCLQATPCIKESLVTNSVHTEDPCWIISLPDLKNKDEQIFKGKEFRELKEKDFRALEKLVKGSGAQVMFSSILPVIGNKEGLDMMSQWVNNWLKAWYHRQGFVFLTLGQFT